jgi:hypothetical protein
VFNTTWDDSNGTALYSSYDYNCPAGVHHNHLTIETPKADNGTNSPNPGTYICNSGLSFYYPDVSLNLQQVAVTADTDGALIGDPTNQIMVLANTPATGGGTTITASGLGATKPNWSPDGTTIAFQGTGGAIWTVPATGGTPVKILDNAASPAWTPYSATAPSGGGGGGGGGGSGGGALAPAVTGLTASPSVFAVAGSGASIARRTGSTISYSDSQAATTTFTVLKPVVGVKNNRGSCVSPVKGKRGKRCTRYVRVGSFTHRDAAGRNSFHFTGRVSGRKLTPGSYELQVVPRAPNGKTGLATIVSFRVIR